MSHEDSLEAALRAASRTSGSFAARGTHSPERKGKARLDAPPAGPSLTVSLSVLPAPLQRLVFAHLDIDETCELAFLSRGLHTFVADFLASSLTSIVLDDARWMDPLTLRRLRHFNLVARHAHKLRRYSCHT
jgi:hypothetical protein